jgi:8-oxo-dGTP pyrophosphatase MutT (NUDIX family)
MIGTMEFSRQVGALPIRRGPDGNLLVLLVTTLQTQRWIIPKGWPWPGQQDCIAAAAEAREEAGVLGAARAGSIGSYTYEKRRPSGRVPVRVAVYLLEVEQELETWPECERRRRAWFSLTAAADAVSEPELRALLLEFKASAEEVAPGASAGTTVSGGPPHS